MGPGEYCTQFRMKNTCQFKKLMIAYSNVTRLILESLRFQFEGDIINETDTPYSKNLSDGDMIKVFQPMD
ncbi:small ubiquitin-related modifier 3-like isoform X2 [Myzus persicae]|nr:small ubiquitin-related modifier 3-like isoform X2 [Myzus persicae]XP_022173349.1 small ubiquitin-related modifier 3-like isoform X2 [Myzus persicae]